MINLDKQLLKIHLRHCTLFLWLQEKSASEAFKDISKVYGNNAITKCTVCNWYRRFKNENYFLDNKVRTSSPKELSRNSLINI